MSPYITCTGFSTKSLDRLPSAATIDFGSVPSQSGTPGKSGSMPCETSDQPVENVSQEVTVESY
jgi:hypothetical protein